VARTEPNLIENLRQNSFYAAFIRQDIDHPSSHFIGIPIIVSVMGARWINICASFMAFVTSGLHPSVQIDLLFFETIS
jgi:hypothetical protein